MLIIVIKKYNLFLINEGITLSNEDIIDVIRSLESEDNKNSKLISRLVNHTEKSGKNVLMNIVQDDDEELVDYVLKFDVDINHKMKTDENVLFFCKSIKMFKKFYDLGVDVHAVDIDIKRNILAYLASKNLFNVELYQALINDGIDINQKDTYGSFDGDTYYSVLVGSLLNKTIVELLIKNGVNLNDDDIQKACFRKLCDTFKYTKGKRKFVLNIFSILFNNGMKIIDEKNFAKNISNMRMYLNELDVVTDFISPLKKYFSEDFIIKLYDEDYGNIEYVKKLLNLDLYPNLYNRVKSYYGENFYKVFADYISEHPYLETSGKYNL